MKRLARRCSCPARRRHRAAARRSPTTRSASTTGCRSRRRSTRSSTSPSGSPATTPTSQNLTAPGGEPHDLELTAQETADVAQADLVVFERGFQPAVDDAVDENAAGDVLDVADVVDLVPFREHGVDSDEDDPHFWQDPLLLADVGDAVADAAGEGRPRPTPTTTQANAADLRADLEHARPGVRRPGWPAASAARSSSATTRSATCSATASRWTRSSASPPTPSRRRPTWPGSRT